MSLDVSATSHDPHQLVVDLQYLETVQAMLRDLGVRHAPLAADDQDELLGLARLRDLTEADGTALEVGEVLALLRQRIAAERDGCQPPMGKNRIVDAVIGEGHKPMSGGGAAVTVAGHKPMYGAEPDLPETGPFPEPLVNDPDAGRGVRVGVVDTPRAPTEPGTYAEPLPIQAGHGEFVHSLIHRQAPGAEILHVGVLNEKTGRADSWETARAIVRLAASGRLDILNLSLGCYTLAGGPPLVIARAIERLGQKVLVVAAAGNHGDLRHLSNGRNRRSACWPAAVPPTVAVGAMERNGTRPGFSPALPWVTCLAPGVDVVASYLTGHVRVGDKVKEFHGQAKWSGTSFAAATVTGAVAARMVSDSVPPRKALDKLLDKGEMVRPYHYGS